MRGIGKIEISVRENRYPARVLEISPLPGTCLLLRRFVFRIESSAKRERHANAKDHGKEKNERPFLSSKETSGY